MVFCCIAVVFIAIVYFIGLWIRQTIVTPKPDKSVSSLPAPARALTGHRAMPVYGHTRLFADRAGDAATLFAPSDLSVRWNPNSRPLGDCFAMFFWGQWRVVVKGEQRAEFVFKSQELKESWPWSPPVTLLGKSCFAFLDQETEVEQMQRLLGRPLSHRQVVLYAPLFAQQAEKCLQDVCNGVFNKKNKSTNAPPGSNLEESIHAGPGSARNMGGYATEEDDNTILNGGVEDVIFKVKWDAFRSYTFDLVDGPVLGLNLWNDKAPPAPPLPPPKFVWWDVGTWQLRDADSNKILSRAELPCREKMLLYMERMKRGVDVIKMTYGSEWMYVWILNEYGRALNARLHVEKIMRQLVSDLAKRDPAVTHHLGHAYHDPSTQPIPLFAMRENALRAREGIFGDDKVQPQFSAARPRSRSMPGASSFFDGGWTSSDDEMGGAFDSLPQPFLPATPTATSNSSNIQYTTPVRVQQDLATARPRSTTVDVAELQYGKGQHRSASMPMAATSTRNNVYDSNSSVDSPEPAQEASPVSPQHTQKSSSSTKPSLYGPAREWRKSMQEQLAKLDNPMTNKTRVAASPASVDPEKPVSQSNRVTVKETKGIAMLTVLERIMKQHDMAGNGLSQVVTSDIAILLWMMLEVGNAWTAMALSLIAADAEALALVQQELDDIEHTYGKDEVFSPSALSRMKYMDALLFEAIRLCPPNLGGMKKTTETIEIKDAGVQIPKDTNIFFCRPTNMTFNIHAAVGKKPENLGRLYPCVELHGFLPLQGMEVPLMVLQSKVFLVCLLQKFVPVVSKKRTFIRRVRTGVKDIIQHNALMESIRHFQSPSTRNLTSPTPTDEEEAPGWEVPQPDFMAHFTKTPFPEPRRVIKIRPRVMDFQTESLAI